MSGEGVNLVTVTVMAGWAWAAPVDDAPSEAELVDVSLGEEAASASVDVKRLRLGRQGGTPRAVLGLGSAAAMGLGSWWMLSLGESLGSGDPAAVLFGAGAVGLLGASTGAAVTLFDPSTDGLADPANTARAFLGIAPDATAYVDEQAPWAAYGGLAPRVQLGRWRLTPMARTGLDIGATREVDPISGGTSSLREWQLGVAFEVRGAVGDPEQPVLDLVWRPSLELRVDDVTYVDGTEATFRRRLGAPLTVGTRWYLTQRQRLEVVAGPRFDEIRWVDGAGWSRGPLYLEAFYSIDLAHAGAITGSRLQLGYVHSKLDGAGLDLAAVNGIFGPALVRYDVRWRPRPTAWALQGGLRLVLADGGGAAVEVGVVPPRKETR